MYQKNTKNIWFKNQREPLHDPSDSEAMKIFVEYWKKEKDRCINGFDIGGVHIPGRLYFHTVYWSIAAYTERKIGNETRKIREIITPILRDIDWDIFNDLERCDAEGKFYDLVGSRDFGKSIIAASCAGQQYSFFSNSEVVISGGVTNYIKLVTDKIEDGLLNLHPMFQKQRLTSDWKKEIVAGWENKQTNLADPKSSMSSIKVRNYENGTKTMAANGTRPAFHLIDEIGTIKNLIGCIKDSDGCWWSGGGSKPSCLVFRTGTGGDMEVGKEAAEVFFNPFSYNSLEFDNPEAPGKKMGRFVSALRARMTFKREGTLYEYLTVNLGMDIPENEQLKQIKILISEEERAKKEWWDIEYDKAVKSGNPKTILKFKAYWPLKASDSFLILTRNDFDVELAKRHQFRLKSQEAKGSNVDLFLNDQGVISHSFSDKLVITEFPVKTQNKDAPVVIYEFPIENPPYGLYVAGVDPYRQGKSAYSDSLGAVYIYKRMNSITGEKYQDMFVASYVARPNDKTKWHEQARLLIKYYNARTLVENDEISFIDYMVAKGDSHYLERQPQWLTEIVPNTTVRREFGIHRSAEKIRTFLHGCFKKYMEETVHKEIDENGNTVKEIQGITKILDPILLEEVIQFDDDLNVDRLVAAELAIALAMKMDPLYGPTGGQADDRILSIFNKTKQKRPLFVESKGMFKNNKRKLFN